MCHSQLNQSSKTSKTSGIDTGSSLKESHAEENLNKHPEIVNKEETENGIDLTTVRKKAEEGRTLYIREAKEAVEENMPPVYRIGQDILDSRKALGEDDAKLVEDSEEMKDVKNKILMIQAYLSYSMPPFAVTQKDENAYKKELDSVKLAISMMYNKLVASMDAWLKVGNTLADYTKERAEMITALRTQVLEEESLFAQSLTDYRQSMIGSSLAKKGESRTWAEMLRFQRSVKIDLDEMDKQPEEVGAGTSEVLKIKRDGKVFYFKPEDATFNGDLNDMIIEMGKLVPGITAEEIRSFIDAVNEEVAGYSEGDAYEHFFNLFVKRDLYDKVKKDSEIPLESFLADVPKKRRKTIENVFRLVFKTYNQQVISVTSAMILPGSNLSRRNVATSRLASLMGIGEMFAESRTAIIKKNGQIISGNLMEDAKGLDVDEAAAKSLKYSKAAEDQLLILPIFDLLCGQVDRHLGNYLYVKGASGEISGIRCIDNDMAFGLLPFDAAMKGENQMKKLTKESLHALPPKFKKTIMAMDGALMKLILRDLLSENELKALEERLIGLQKALKEVEEDSDKKAASLSPAKKREAQDPELIKLAYFTSLRAGLSTKELQRITNFYEPLFPSSSKIASRVKQRKKDLGAGK